MKTDTPNSLFKYVAPARVDILVNEKIAFTPPDRFNDILDVRPNIKAITNREYLGQIEKEAQEKFIRSLPPGQRPKTPEQHRRLVEFLSGGVDHIIGQAQALAAKWHEELPKLISQHFGILCFSEPHDSHLMWAHYASEHRGFVIEADTQADDFQQLGQLRKVEYLPQPPVYDAAVGARGFWRQKLDHWAYEREWRIVRELENCERVDANNGPPVYLCSFPRSLIKAVYFGVRTTADSERQIRTLLAGTSIKLFRARAHPETGNLRFEAV
jgi:Protein of unknown function (DUF2971)